MNTLIMVLGFMGLGGTELMVIGVIVLLLFGGKKIPELMKGLGQGISEFKKAKDDISIETKELSKKE